MAGPGEELARDDGAIHAYQDAAAGGDIGVVPVWAGEGIGLITSLTSAADLVTLIANEAEEAVRRAGEMLMSGPVL